MIELVILACMLDIPTRCKDFNLNFDSETVPAESCIKNSQIAMAQWQGKHLGWQIKSWKCDQAGQTSKT